MSLTTLIASKEESLGYVPILLYDFVLTDASTLHVCTNPFNLTGYSYIGINYQPFVKSEDLAVIQGMGVMGIDQVPNATITLVDALGTLWALDASVGFGGATLVATIVLADIGRTGVVFSTGNEVVYTALCDSPSADDNTGRISIPTSSFLNFSRKNVPGKHCQPRCYNDFPMTPDQRADGASNKFSIFYGCGYSPDISGGVGNTPVQTQCDRTASACQGKGMFKRDSSGRLTGRFTGSQWAPPTQYWKGKQFISGTTVDGYDNLNQARWGMLYTLLYGENRIAKPAIMPNIGDPNSTRFEVVVGTGRLQIMEVVCNGVIVPRNDAAALLLFRYYQITDGTRNGTPTEGPGYDGRGDPYGGQTTINIVVPISLQQSNSTAQVIILARRIDLIIPSTDDIADLNSWPQGFTTNSAIITANFLVEAGLAWNRINIAQLNQEAAFCQQGIPYTTNQGTMGSIERYRASFTVSDKVPASQILLPLRTGFMASITSNGFTGLVDIVIEKTLADQQGTLDKVPGTNNTTALGSVHCNGSTGSGYSAYDFDENNYIEGTLKIDQNPLSTAGNVITIQFQDSQNGFVQDSTTNADTNAIILSTRENDNLLSTIGIENFDQANRCANINHFKTNYANIRGDAKGATNLSWKTTVKASLLKTGQICRVSNLRLGISQQYVRLKSIKLNNNGKEYDLTGTYHSDNFYIDSVTQNPGSIYSNPSKSIPNRDAYPWKPGTEVQQGSATGPFANFSPFSITIVYAANSDGSATTVISPVGYKPVNSLALDIQPPLVGSQGTFNVTSSFGGGFTPGEYYVGLVGLDSTGSPSAMTRPIRIIVAPGSSTNSLQLNNIFWPITPTNCTVFVGKDELTMVNTLSVTGAPASIEIKFPVRKGYGPPDIKANSFLIRTKYIIHGGVAAFVISSTTQFGITYTGATYTSNQFANRVVSLYGNLATPGTKQPVVDLNIVSNTADTLVPDTQVFRTGSSPRPILQPGDLVVIRAHGINVTVNSIDDPNFQNFFYSTGLTPGAEKGNLVRVIAGTGVGQQFPIDDNTATGVTIKGKWDITPDATSVWIIVASTFLPDVITSAYVATKITSSAPDNIGSVNLPNQRGSYLMDILIADALGNTGAEWLAPFREIFSQGNPGTNTGSGTTLDLRTALSTFSI